MQLLDGCLGIHSDGFHPLAKMPSLRDLSLRHTNLNDDGGSFLGSLRLLRALHLEGCTDLTDEILVYLEPLRELTYLNLSFCNISDLGLHLLEDMHMNLQALRVSGCPGITEAGLDVALRESCTPPDCSLAVEDARNNKCTLPWGVGVLTHHLVLHRYGESQLHQVPEAGLREATTT